MGISHIQETKEDCHEPNSSRNDEIEQNKKNKNRSSFRRSIATVGISHIQETKEDCHEPNGSRNDELKIATSLTALAMTN